MYAVGGVVVYLWAEPAACLSQHRSTPQQAVKKKHQKKNQTVAAVSIFFEDTRLVDLFSRRNEEPLCRYGLADRTALHC